MFNVTILKLKDIIKYTIGLGMTIIAVVTISKYFQKNINRNKKEKIVQEVKSGFQALTTNNLLDCFEQTIPVAANINEEYKNIANEDDYSGEENILHSMLKTQISSIKGMEIIEEKAKSEKNFEVAKNERKNEGENKGENKSEDNLQEGEIKETGTNETETNETNGKDNTSSNIELDEKGLKTEVITNNPITENFNAQYGKVKIKNQTSYELTEAILTPDITIENKNILIFHTHSCESYTSSEKYTYTPTGTYRTTDLNYTVTRVGTELETYLKQNNYYNVIHNMDYHDYPAYNGSYTRSLTTVENILKQNSADIIIDIHRDAIGSRNDYAPTVKIGEGEATEEAAQLMFVIGTNQGGLWHPNWNQNLKFAIKVQQKAEELYPGLFKPIMLTTSRYNQHTGKYASIIEVGATGNTLEQCLTSMKYLANIICRIGDVS